MIYGDEERTNTSKGYYSCTLWEWLLKRSGELLGKWLDEEVANRRLYRNIIRGRSIAGRLKDWKMKLTRPLIFRRCTRSGSTFSRASFSSVLVETDCCG